MPRTIVFLVSSALLASAYLTQASAEEVKYDVQNCYASVAQVTQADGLMAGSYTASVIGGINEGPLEKMSGRCLGAFSIVDGQLNENGTCEWVNATGDKLFSVYARKGDPAKDEGSYHYVKGTGKFAGVAGGGKWIPIKTLPPAPGGVAIGCIHDWGSATIK
jgi:hypothetical protein